MSTKSEFLTNVQKLALEEAERKFRSACCQLTLLNTKLEELQERYHRAKTDNFRCFRYNIRLKLACVEGVRNMYYDYAFMQAEIVAELRQQLFGEIVDIVQGDEEPTDDVMA